jgi:RimJ/RimL family protein N-acetyltransferase
MLAGVREPALQHLRRQGFQVEEARERGAIYPTLLIASSIARQIQTAAPEAGPSGDGVELPVGPVLDGREITVRWFTQADLPTLHHWQHAHPRPGYATVSQTTAPTMAELKVHFAQESKASDRQRFAIEAADGKLIGYLLYHDMREDVRSVFLDFVVGDPDFWVGTWGQEAIRLLVEHLFGALGIHRINIVVSELQQSVLDDLSAIGFCQDGVLRHNEILDGRYIDHLFLSLLEDEYERWPERAPA